MRMVLASAALAGLISAKFTLVLQTLLPPWAQPLLFLVALLLGGFVFSASAAQDPDIKKLKLGDAAPDFKLLGIDGRMTTLADFPASKSPVLMVVFLSNHCPYSHAAETRLLPLAPMFPADSPPPPPLNPLSSGIPPCSPLNPSRASFSMLAESIRR